MKHVLLQLDDEIFNKLPEEDKKQLLLFQNFLLDSATGMSFEDLRKKYGDEYLGSIKG
jgi:hypothetical protein